ncbi:MAG TPA: DUF1801 domain-containing protein [Acidimicrobiia bacterium]|nr:DUF1801 domain-containing protein [Acidimicrobiia bacterium]
MRNSEVDAWFDKKKHPLEDAMQAVRDVALSADPRIEESIKWSTPTYSYRGNIFSFNPAKNFVSLLFHTGAKIPGDHPGLEGEGETARVMRFADVDDVHRRSEELAGVLRAWCRWKDE